MSAQDQVREFHVTMNLPISRVLRKDCPQMGLRQALIEEEATELREALFLRDTPNIVEAADALADIVYVCYGAAITWGIDLDKVIAEVHAANLRKLWPDGKPRVTEAGKILKPEGFVGPDIASVLGLNK